MLDDDGEQEVPAALDEDAMQPGAAARPDAPEHLEGERAELPDEHVDVPERYVPLAYVGVELVLPSTHPVLILAEADGRRRELRIPIGIAEGSAIAYAAGAIETPRPLTHALFAQAIVALGATIETVRITEVTRSAYRAELVLTGPTGQQRLDCRVSDAVCLALRHVLPVPITAAASVLDQAAYDSTA